MNNDITSRRSLKNYARTVLSEDSPTNIALLKMFDEIIDNAPDCWTPVSEGSPNTDDTYLCTIQYGDDTDDYAVEYKVYSRGRWLLDPILNEHVVAWMPDPEPYKEV